MIGHGARANERACLWKVDQLCRGSRLYSATLVLSTATRWRREPPFLAVGHSFSGLGRREGEIWQTSRGSARGGLKRFSEDENNAKPNVHRGNDGRWSRMATRYKRRSRAATDSGSPSNLEFAVHRPDHCLFPSSFSVALHSSTTVSSCIDPDRLKDQAVLFLSAATKAPARSTSNSSSSTTAAGASNATHPATSVWLASALPLLDLLRCRVPIATLAASAVPKNPACASPGPA
jgi:hypothetical protein